VYSLQCIVYIVYRILYIVYYILYIVYCILYIVYCILYIVYCILYIVYCILCIVYCVLYIDCILYIVSCIVIQSIDSTAYSVTHSNVEDGVYNVNNDDDSDTHLLMCPTGSQCNNSATAVQHQCTILGFTLLARGVTVNVLPPGCFLLYCLFNTYLCAPLCVPTSVAVPGACCRCSAEIL
jgi:hypothetical protein